jgi:hypothetical protein
MQKESHDQTIPDEHQGTKISTNPNPRETREREREEKVGKVPWSMGMVPERMAGQRGARAARGED